MYVNISKNVNNKVDSYPALCHSRRSGNLSSPICRGTMNCAFPLLVFTVFCLQHITYFGQTQGLPLLVPDDLIFLLLLSLFSSLSAVRYTLFFAANLILYEVPSIVLDLLQMEHQLIDKWPSES